MADRYEARLDALDKKVVGFTTHLDGALAKFDRLVGGSGTGGGNGTMSNSLGGFSAAGLGRGGALLNFMGGAASFGASVIGAIGKSMPSVTDTMNMSMQSYQTALLAPGANKYGVAQSNFNAMRGGITSPGAQAMVGAGLSSMGIMFSNNYNSTYQQMMRNVGNSARYLGQDNATAMQAVAGLGQGSMSANLTATMGIYTSDVNTGKSKTESQIFGEIWQQMRSGQGRMNAQDVMNSFYKGNLGASLSNIGFSDAQKQRFLQFAVNQVGGKGMDLSSMSQTNALLGKNAAMGNTNPMQASMDIYSTTTHQMITAMKPYEQGMKDAAELYKKLNPMIEDNINKFGRVNAEMQTFLGTNVGQALTEVGQGLITALQAIVTGLMGLSLLKGGSGGGGLLSRGPKAAPKPGYYDYAVETSQAAARAAQTGELTAGQIAAGAAAGASAVSGANAANYFMLSKNKQGLASYVKDQVSWTQAKTGKFFSATELLMYGTGPTGGPKNNNAASRTSDQGNQGVHAHHAPANGPITAHLHQKGPMWGANGHNGTDYGVPDGSPIYAVADGVVSTDAVGAGARSYGHYVKVDHGNGYQTLYAHLDPSSADVHPGQPVKAGQKIGKSGHSGHVTGPHLHFEVQKNGVSVDPTAMLSGAVGGNVGSKGLKKSSSTSNMSTVGAATSLFSTSSSGFSANAWSVAEALGASGNMSTASVSSWKGTQTPRSSSVGTSSGPSANSANSSPVNGSFNGLGMGGTSVITQGSGSLGGGKIEINLHIASASAQEARKFAGYVKQILEEEHVLANMGSR